MVIDNVEQIRGLLEFPEIRKDDDSDHFYVVQLLQRQKDNPTKSFGNPNFRNNSNRCLHQFQIYSLEDFDLKVSNIIELAKHFQARAYINLNLRNSKDVFAEIMKNMAARFQTHNYKKLHRLYNEAVGETNAAKKTRKSWVVDIDSKDTEYVAKVINTIIHVRGSGGDGCGKVLATIPTKSGFHLITTSFDSKTFSDSLTKVGVAVPDIHKNNPTILWMETDWSAFHG